MGNGVGELGAGDGELGLGPFEHGADGLDLTIGVCAQHGGSAKGLDGGDELHRGEDLHGEVVPGLVVLALGAVGLTAVIEQTHHLGVHDEHGMAGRNQISQLADGLGGELHGAIGHKPDRELGWLHLHATAFPAGGTAPVHDAGRHLFRLGQEMLDGAFGAVGVQALESGAIASRHGIEDGGVAGRGGGSVRTMIGMLGGPGTNHGPLAGVGVTAIAQPAELTAKPGHVEGAQIALVSQPPLGGIPAAAALLVGRGDKLEPTHQIYPSHLGDLPGHFPGVDVAGLVDGRGQHEVEAIGVKLGHHRLAELRGNRLAMHEHGFGQIRAAEMEVSAAACAFPGHCRQFGLRGQPSAHGLAIVFLGIEVHGHERRAHDHAEVELRIASEMGVDV